MTDASYVYLFISGLSLSKCFEQMFTLRRLILRVQFCFVTEGWSRPEEDGTTPVISPPARPRPAKETSKQKN